MTATKRFAPTSLEQQHSAEADLVAAGLPDLPAPEQSVTEPVAVREKAGLAAEPPTAALPQTCKQRWDRARPYM